MSSVKHIALTVALLSIFALAVCAGRRADSAEEGSSMKITVGEHQFTVTLGIRLHRGMDAFSARKVETEVMRQ